MDNADRLTLSLAYANYRLRQSKIDKHIQKLSSLRTFYFLLLWTSALYCDRLSKSHFLN